MKRQARRLEVTSAAGFPRGAWLQVDEGENMELTQVLAARGTTLKVGRVRWWHRAAWWLAAIPAVAASQWRRWWFTAADAGKAALCRLGGHRLITEGRDGNGGCLTLWCWCERRYLYIGDEGDE